MVKFRDLMVREWRKYFEVRTLYTERSVLIRNVWEVNEADHPFPPLPYSLSRSLPIVRTKIMYTSTLLSSPHPTVREQGRYSRSLHPPQSRTIPSSVRPALPPSFHQPEHNTYVFYCSCSSSRRQPYCLVPTPPGTLSPISPSCLHALPRVPRRGIQQPPPSLRVLDARSRGCFHYVSPSGYGHS
jgi:hypothetical protein